MKYVTLAAALSVVACSAQESSIEWKDDCVGRMQLSVPSDIEVAAATAKSWREDKPDQVARFPDEEIAGWSAHALLGGIQISHAWTNSEVATALKEARAGRDRFRPGGPVQKSGEPRSFRELPTAPVDGVAWDYGNTRYAVLLAGSHLVRWTVSVPKGQAMGDMDRDYQLIRNGLRARPTFSNPQESGVCLPYIFVRDDGKSRRFVSTTYRLKAHPDVTIMLRDQTAAWIDPAANPRVYDPERQSDDFWGRYDSVYRKSLQSVWGDSYRRVQLGPSRGLASFVKIVREDGAADYAYLAIARGDPDSAKDTPDLMLYVIQNSKNAKSRGIDPVTREELLAIAQRVAASIKRKPSGGE